MKSLGIAVLAAVLAPAMAAAELLREQSSKSVDPTGISALVVRNSRGAIEVGPSPDGRIHITALKEVRARTRAIARELAGEIQVELSREGRGYHVQVRYPKSRKIQVDLWRIDDHTIPRSDVNLTIALPDGIELVVDGSRVDVSTRDLGGLQTIDTAGGDVAVASARGSLRVSTASGDVRVEDARGAARVSCSSGSVEVRGIGGALTVSTGSGDVTVGQARDSVVVGTGSGDIEVDGARLGAEVRSTSGDQRLFGIGGRLVSRTGSGQIELRPAPGFAGVAVTGGSGGVHLDLDREASCRLELETGSGSIELVVRSRTHSVTRHRVTATVRQGGPLVAIRTQSGDITVTGGEH